MTAKNQRRKNDLLVRIFVAAGFSALMTWLVLTSSGGAQLLAACGTIIGLFFILAR